MRVLALMLALPAMPAAAQETRFDVTVHFDTASTTALQEKGEMVIVSAVFSGEPVAGNVLPVDEMGMLFLGREEYTIWPLDQTIHLGGSLGGAPVGNVAAPLVNVNVYSARFIDQDNLLDCGIVDGPTDEFSKAEQQIDCKLIGG